MLPFQRVWGIFHSENALRTWIVFWVRNDARNRSGKDRNICIWLYFSALKNEPKWGIRQNNYAALCHQQSLNRMKEKEKTSLSGHVKALVRPPSGCFSIIHFGVHKFPAPKKALQTWHQCRRVNENVRDHLLWKPERYFLLTTRTLNAEQLVLWKARWEVYQMKTKQMWWIHTYKKEPFKLCDYVYLNVFWRFCQCLEWRNLSDDDYSPQILKRCNPTKTIFTFKWRVLQWLW